MMLSLISLIGGIVLLSKTRVKRKVLVWILLEVSFLVTILFQVADHLSGNGFDNAVVYHLMYGVKGSGFQDFFGVMFTSVGFIIGSFFLSYLIVFVRNKKVRKYVPKTMRSAYILIVFSILINPLSISIFDIGKDQFIPPNIEELSEDFSKYYEEPFLKGVGERKNLVFIYTEGVEQTHFDEELFPGLTPNLKELQSESLHFTNITSTVGTRFTIGGIVGSHCGIPLLASSHLNSLGNADTFLPHARCLGDLLREKGYNLAFFGGADLEFSGKGKFLTGHGFGEVFGLKELQPKIADQEYASWWGLYDDTTFSFALDHFKKLSRSDENFALFILTMDAHHPWGNPSRSCDGLVYGDGKTEILNGVHCSDKLVSQLVREILNSPNAEDTVVVVASDHLALQNAATKTLEKSKGGRNDLFMIFNSGEEPGSVDRLGATLDTGMTVLPFIGFEGSIGLGRDLLSEDYSESVARYIQDSVKDWKPVYAQFWDFPKIDERITLDIQSPTLSGENFVSIDERKFGIPIMVEFWEDLETDIIFKHEQSDLINVDEEYSIFKERINIRENRGKAYLIVDLCSEAGNIDYTLEDEGMCFIFGREGVVLESGSIFGEKVFEVEDLLRAF